MKIGIVGLPNVGKSTLFKALTKNPVDISNYPFCTIEPNIGIVTVPDDRLSRIAKMAQSKKIVPTVVEFVDIAGLVKGASKGEGLGNQFLANIREVDAVAHIVRVYENKKITHVHETIDPLRDIEVINAELMLADLETAQKTVTRLEKEERGQNKDAGLQREAVQKIRKGLEKGVLAKDVVIDFSREPIEKIVREMSLLTMKPVLYVYNMSDGGDKLSEELAKKPHTSLDIKIEEELSDMSAEEAQELGVQSHLKSLITMSYALLDLLTFFTTGEDESRAWTIVKGATAPEAGAVIHSDFQEKFICADAISWGDLLASGSWAKARDKGLIQTVGKQYVMRDGDVVEFKHG